MTATCALIIEIAESELTAAQALDEDFPITLNDTFPVLRHAIDCAVQEKLVYLAHDDGSVLDGDIVQPFSALILVAACASAELLAVCIKKYPPTCFVIVWHQQAVSNPLLRQKLEFSGANAILHSAADLLQVLTALQPCTPGTDGVTCPYCLMERLGPLAFCYHLSTYHISWQTSQRTMCPLCNHHCRLQVHVHDHHFIPLTNGPVESPSGVFALICCYVEVEGVLHWLLVQEFAMSGFWLPGGQLNRGESLVEGVRRECVEEAGVDVQVEGFVEVRIKPNWRRVIFVGTPLHQGLSCKVVPDFESFGACWGCAEQLRDEELRFRSAGEVKWMLRIGRDRSCIKPLKELHDHFPGDAMLLKQIPT